MKIMKIFKISSAKNKIAQYNIQNPFLIYFINSYENKINWNQVKSENDINIYIKNNLIPQIVEKTKIESPNSLYVRDIDLEKEFEQNIQNPQVQQAYNIYRQDPEAAKKIILSSINEQKKRIFDDWLNYILEENDVYSDEPAFQYAILNSIFNQTNFKSKKSCMPLNALAVASIYDKIKSSSGTESFSINNLYKEEFFQSEQKEFKQKGPKNSTAGWIKIPSKINDPKNYDSNKDRLVAYSIPNGWCTGSGMADRYLSQGDFHLYVLEGKAEVAIRMQGNQVAEIQGERNKRPYAYVKEIEDYFRKININPEDNRHYKELMEAKNLNENLSNPDLIDEFIINHKDKKHKNLIYLISNELLDNKKVIDFISHHIDHLRHFLDLSKMAKLKLYENNPQKIKELIFEKINVTNVDYSFLERIPQQILEDCKDILNQSFEINLNNNALSLTTIPQNIDDLKNEKVKQHLENNQFYNLAINVKRSAGDKNPEKIIQEMGFEMPIKSDYRVWNGRFYETEEEEEFNLDFQEYKNKMNNIHEDDVRDDNHFRKIMHDAWIKYLNANEDEKIKRIEEAMDSNDEYTNYYIKNSDYPADYYDLHEEIHYIVDDVVWQDPKNLDEIPYHFRENFEYEGTIHFVWLNYFTQNISELEYKHDEALGHYMGAIEKNQDDYYENIKKDFEQKIIEYFYNNGSDTLSDEDAFKLMIAVCEEKDIYSIVDNFIQKHISFSDVDDFDSDNLDYILQSNYLKPAFSEYILQNTDPNSSGLHLDISREILSYFSKQERTVFIKHLINKKFDFNSLNQSVKNKLLEDFSEQEIKILKAEAFDNENQLKFNFYKDVKNQQMQKEKDEAEKSNKFNYKGYKDEIENQENQENK